MITITAVNGDTDDVATSPLTLSISEADAVGIDELPRLPKPEPEDYFPPEVKVRDVVTGRAYFVSRFPCGADCDCAVYARSIGEPT